ncbi:MAG TPA: ABC transporter permease [Clostridia bacterium]|nr:ABC transporter permease [Clostridia bacterium]
MIFHIALKDLRVTFRDRKALIFMILMPLVLIIIIGASFGSMFENQLRVEKFVIGVWDKDTSVISGQFVNDFLRGKMSSSFETYKINSTEEMNQKLKSKKLSSVIVIPKNFSDDIHRNKQATFEIKSNVDNQFNSLIVKMSTKGYAKTFSIYNDASKVLANAFHKYNVRIEKSFNGIDDNSAIIMELQKKSGMEKLDFKELNQKKNKVLSGIQFYSTTMLVMFMLFGATAGTRLIIEERETRTLGRIMCAKAAKSTLIIGKFLGLLFICFVQALILILFTHFVYSVDWGASIPGVLLVTLCSTFAAAAFGMFIAALSKSPGAADGFSQIFIQSFTLLSGGMVPIYVFPPAMKVVAKFTLNWWAVNGFQDIMLGKGIADVIQYMGVLIIMGIVFLSIGIWRFKTE